MVHAGDVCGPVLQALAPDRTTEFGAPGARVEVLRRIDGPFSSVLRVRILTPARAVHAYTKILKPRQPGTEQLSRIDRFLNREFAATSAFYNALQQDADIAAVRPVALLPESRALATEEVPGPPFGELLAEFSQPQDRLEAAGRRLAGAASGNLTSELVPRGVQHLLRRQRVAPAGPDAATCAIVTCSMTSPAGWRRRRSRP
jgi:hypothetical protein